MSEQNKSKKTRTTLTTLGRDTKDQKGFINPPIYKGSTVLFPDVAALRANNAIYTYGRHATPTSRAFCDAMTELEGGDDTVLTESGTAAVILVLHTFAKQGAHFLVTDNVYSPVRLSLDVMFKKYGVQVTYFDPHIGADIEKLITDKTTLILCETPGSLSMEVHNLPAITQVANKANIPVAVDNTWATPLFLQPLELGADITIHAGAKYILGHSDGFIGSVTAREKYFKLIYKTRRHLGYCASSDEAHMALRGLRTLAIRMDQHMETGLKLARWFEQQDYVERVLHPGLETHPDHDIWKRDFAGAGGLFSVIFKENARDRLDARLNNLTHFGLGFSYGGYESLALPFDPRNLRTATQWNEGPAVRFYTGLEDVDDLLADISENFKTLT